MIISTSYFGMLDKIENPISIARYNPMWYGGRWYPTLAPSKRILSAYRRDNNAQDFSDSFCAYLETINPRKVYHDFKHYGNNITLLCYERPTAFCHRHLVAKWLQQNLNIQVLELFLPTNTLF